MKIKVVLILVVLTVMVGGTALVFQWLQLSREKQEAKVNRSNRILTLLTKVPEDNSFAGRYVSLSSLDMTTGEKTELVRWAASQANVVLSPKKDKIAYSINPNDRAERVHYEGYKAGEFGLADLWISDLRNQNKQLVSKSAWENTTPKWSMDGRYVAYGMVIARPAQHGREHLINIYDTRKKTKQFLGSFFGILHKIIEFSLSNELLYCNDGQFLYKVNISNKSKEKIYEHENKFHHNFVMSPDSRSIVVFKTWE